MLATVFYGSQAMQLFHFPFKIVEPSMGITNQVLDLTDHLFIGADHLKVSQKCHSMTHLSFSMALKCCKSLTPIQKGKVLNGHHK